MAVRATNTFEEELQKILTDVARLKTMPDADLDFCVQLEIMILQKIREPNDMLAAAQAQKAGLPAPGGQPGVPGMPPGQIPPGMGPGPMGPPPGPPGAGGPGGLPMPPVPGLRMQPNMPNPDELRRLVQQQ